MATIEIASPKKKVRKKGKRGRKIGNKRKKPSAKRYLAERRWEKNKARRAARRAKLRCRHDSDGSGPEPNRG